MKRQILILLSVTVVACGGLSSCKQNKPASEPAKPTDTGSETQPPPPKHIVDGCPTHENLKELIASGRPLIAQADALLLSSSPDPSGKQALQAKLKSWDEEIKYAKSNAGLLLSAEGTNTFPELTLAIDDLDASSKVYRSALDMPPEKDRQSKLSARAGRAAFDIASKLVDGSVSPRSSKVLNFLGDKKYRDIIRVERSK